MSALERKDYSLHLPTVTQKNAYHEIIRRARHIIHLLSLNSDRVEEGICMVGNESVVLPKKYYFGNVPVFFLPGWGSYALGDVRTLNISFHLPHGKDELLNDVGSVEAFLDRYTALSGKSAKQKAEDAWKRKMRNRIA